MDLLVKDQYHKGKCRRESKVGFRNPKLPVSRTNDTSERQGRLVEAVLQRPVERKQVDAISDSKTTTPTL